MTKRWALIGALVLGECMLLVMSAIGFASLLRDARDTSPKQEAVVYSCGYVAGQRSIMSRLPSLFTATDLPNAPSACGIIRKRAVHNGFTTAKED